MPETKPTQTTSARMDNVTTEQQSANRPVLKIDDIKDDAKTMNNKWPNSNIDQATNDYKMIVSTQEPHPKDKLTMDGQRAIDDISDPNSTIASRPVATGQKSLGADKPSTGYKGTIDNPDRVNKSSNDDAKGGKYLSVCLFSIFDQWYMKYNIGNLNVPKSVFILSGARRHAPSKVIQRNKVTINAVRMCYAVRKRVLWLDQPT